MNNLKNHQLLNPRWLGAYILLLALFLRLGYVLTLEIDVPIRADAAKYVTIAHNLLTNGVYSHYPKDNPEPSSLITPGYPLFLSSILYLTGDINVTYQIALFLQAILSAITVLLAYHIALRFLPLWFSVTAGVLAAISPHLIVAAGYLLSETLFAFFLVISTYVLLLAIETPSKARFLVYGLLMGCTALVRPAALLLPIFTLLPVIFLKDFKMNPRISIIIAAAGFLTLWMPWQVWAPLHAPKATNAEKVFAFGTYPDFTYKNPELRGYPYREDTEYKKMAADFGYALSTLVDRAAEDPVKYFSWYFVGKPTSYWGWSMIQGMGGPFIYPVKKTLYDKSSVAKFTYLSMKLLHYVLISVLFIGLFSAAIYIIATRNLFIFGVPALVTFLIIVYTTLLHTVFAPLPRYSVPFYPFMYTSALFFIYYFARHQRVTHIFNRSQGVAKPNSHN